jgi:outer membrane immunogenic protein
VKTLRLAILRLAATIAGAALIAVVAGSAQAADMPLKARPAPVPVYTWTGFYGGINGGYGWSDRTVTFTPGDPLIQAITCNGAAIGTCALPASNKLHGGFGGLQVGYNWQVNPFFLAGLDADFQGSAIRGSVTNPPFLMAAGVFGGPSQIGTEHSVTWFGTVRGRLGFLPTDRLLIYGTGGFAYGRVEANSVLTPAAPNVIGGFGFGINCTGVAFPNCFTGNSTRTATGWTAGGGFEFALSPNISLKAEYLYINLGTNSHALVAVNGLGGPPASFVVSTKVDYSLARVGLNYRFDPPVVAKY